MLGSVFPHNEIPKLLKRHQHWLVEIHPQNAVDLNMLKEDSFMYQYFKKQ